MSCASLRSYNPPPLRGDPDVDSRAIRGRAGVEVAFALRFVGAIDGAPLMTMRLRNGTPYGAPIDVGRLHIIGNGPKGPRPLTLVDPRGELERLTLEPGVTAKEEIRLADDRRQEGELATICIDPSAMLGAGPTAAVCFAPTSDASWTVVR